MRRVRQKAAKILVKSQRTYSGTSFGIQVGQASSNFRLSSEDGLEALAKNRDSAELFVSSNRYLTPAARVFFRHVSAWVDSPD